MRIANLALGGVVLILCCAAPARAGVREVWAVDDGEKICRDDLESPLKSGQSNSVWDGTHISLFAARNEIVAFQLIMEADDAGARAVEVTVSDVTNGEARIRGSHPLPSPNDYLGVGVELFTEHYLHVEAPSYSNGDWGWFNTTGASNPKITGWIPDALIPFSAAPGKGGAPFDIPPDCNQGLWVDIYVPKGAVSGTYAGAITITAGEQAVATIPLALEVLELRLPDENHYRSMVYYSGGSIAARHGLTAEAETWEMILNYHRMAHRHRLELIGDGSWEELQALKGTLTGDAFTRAKGYQGPGEGVGNTLYSVNTYGVTFPDTEEAYRRESDRWVAWFDENAPDVEYFLYLVDEPRRHRYLWIRERTSWIHDNPGPGSRLPVFVTVGPSYFLAESVDIWCPHAPWYWPALGEVVRERGDRMWVYSGVRPHTPSDLIDEHGIGFRLKPWIGHYAGVPRWFTWESTHWVGNHNEVDAEQPKNPFGYAVTFQTRPEHGASGDGTLFYPGQDRIFPEEDRGYPGPISSIRMKMYRRGIQDVEYMWLAEQAGHGEEVRALLAERLPAVLREAEKTPSWSNANADYERVRRRLAEMVAER